jgi:hypothetical protein
MFPNHLKIRFAIAEYQFLEPEVGGNCFHLNFHGGIYQCCIHGIHSVAGIEAITHNSGYHKSHKAYQQMHPPGYCRQFAAVFRLRISSQFFFPFHKPLSLILMMVCSRRLSVTFTLSLT